VDWPDVRLTATGTAGAVLVAVAATGAALTADARPSPEPPLPLVQAEAATEIRMLYPPAEKGMEWVADWDDPVLSDPWLQQGSRDIRYRASDGVLSITGNVHRLYVRDPELEQQWGDVEITTYFQRVGDDDIPYSGMVAVARTNHGTTGDVDLDSCDSRGLSARLRNDGTVDFGKETSHPNTDSQGQRQLWENGLPKDRWIGYKYVVYDVGDTVRQEVWLDLTEGENGGTWMKVAENTDRGGSWGREACAPGIDPTIPLTNSTSREGSESGLPNTSVYFRADGLWQDGLLYKWTSAREIDIGAGS
jgi:hypothetical protein